MRNFKWIEKSKDLTLLKSIGKLMIMILFLFNIMI